MIRWAVSKINVLEKLPLTPIRTKWLPETKKDNKESL